MGKIFSKKKRHNMEASTTDPFSVYVPLESLTESTVRSIISVIEPNHHPYWDHSERSLLIFLLAINRKLTEIEQLPEDTATTQVKNVRQWLVDSKGEPLDWEKLQQRCDEITKNKSGEIVYYDWSRIVDPYFELTLQVVSCFLIHYDG